MPLQRLPLKDYRGGVNLRDSPFDLLENEAQRIRDVILSRRGVLTQRAGLTRFDTSGFPVGKQAEHMQTWVSGAGPSKLIMLSIDGDIYSCTTGGALTLRKDGTAGTVWDFESTQDALGNNRLWAVNGVDTPQVWDGSAATTSNWVTAPGGLAIPNGKSVRVWKNKMCIAGVAATPQRLFFSDVGDPQKPDVANYGTNWIDIKSADDDNDPIVALDIVRDFLIVFKKRSVWAVTNPVDFSNRRLGAPGCEGRFQSAELEGILYFYAREGVYATDGSNSPEYRGQMLEPYFRDSVSSTSLDKVRVRATRDRKILVLAPVDSGENNRVLELIPDMILDRQDGGSAPSWFIHHIGLSDLCLFSPSSQPVLIGSGAGKLYTVLSGTSDDGVAISSEWLSGWKSLFPEEPYERIRRLNIEMSGQLVVDVYKNFMNTPSFSQALSSASGVDPLWSGGIWGGGVWSTSTPAALKRVRPETRGQYHAVGFRNSELNKTFSIFAAELSVRGGKEH